MAIILELNFPLPGCTFHCWSRTCGIVQALKIRVDGRSGFESFSADQSATLSALLDHQAVKVKVIAIDDTTACSLTNRL